MTQSLSSATKKNWADLAYESDEEASDLDLQDKPPLIKNNTLDNKHGNQNKDLHELVLQKAQSQVQQNYNERYQGNLKGYNKNSNQRGPADADKRIKERIVKDIENYKSQEIKIDIKDLPESHLNYDQIKSHFDRYEIKAINVDKRNRKVQIIVSKMEAISLLNNFGLQSVIGSQKANLYYLPLHDYGKPKRQNDQGEHEKNSYSNQGYNGIETSHPIKQEVFLQRSSIMRNTDIQQDNSQNNPQKDPPKFLQISHRKNEFSTSSNKDQIYYQREQAYQKKDQYTTNEFNQKSQKFQDDINSIRSSKQNKNYYYDKDYSQDDEYNQNEDKQYYSESKYPNYAKDNQNYFKDQKYNEDEKYSRKSKEIPSSSTNNQSEYVEKKNGNQIRGSQKQNYDKPQNRKDQLIYQPKNKNDVKDNTDQQKYEKVTSSKKLNEEVLHTPKKTEQNKQKFDDFKLDDNDENQNSIKDHMKEDQLDEDQSSEGDDQIEELKDEKKKNKKNKKKKNSQTTQLQFSSCSNIKKLAKQGNPYAFLSPQQGPKK